MQVETRKGFTTITLTTEEESELRSTIGVSNVRQIKLICDLYENIHWAHIKEKTEENPVMFTGWGIATTAFPDWSPPFDMPEGWLDVSYRNDTCPHIELATDSNITCWIDYEDEGEREGNNKRFYMTYVVQDEASGTIIHTDNIDTIKFMLTAMGKESLV